MIERRLLLQMGLAAGVLVAGGGLLTREVLRRTTARQALSYDDLMDFDAKGQVSLLHFGDIHAQITPIYFREPSTNIGVGDVAGLVPHLTGEDMVRHYDLKAPSDIYALTSVDFAELAQAFGKVGGVDRMARLVKDIQATRPGKTLLLDSGDTWHGSFTTLQDNAQHMVQIMNQLGVDAMASHFEFTLGEEEMLARVDEFRGDFLAGNVRDVEWDEDVFDAFKIYERNGVNIGVVGQAFPYTSIANPKWMFPAWGFGIQTTKLAENVEKARAAGAQVVVLLSHNGFDVDRKVAQTVPGIDVILSGHTHDALPRPERVGSTLIVASGSNGKFLSRLDLDVGPDGIKDYSYKLIPIFADIIAPDEDMAALVKRFRAPHEGYLSEVVGQTAGTLYRRGNVNGTFDDLICDALLQQRDAQIALSPGFRWGPSLVPGQAITREDIHDHTAITYPQAYRTEMTGQTIKSILEDVADNLYHPDPFFQQGGDMVRVGGMSFELSVGSAIGNRIQNLQLTDGTPIEASESYVVAGWGSINEGTEGPPAWDVIFEHLAENPEVSGVESNNIRLT